MSPEELEQIRKDFLDAISLLGERNPEIYRRLYQVS